MTTTVSAYAAQGEKEPLKPFSLSRRSLTAHDVMVDIDYCGVCHSDIHQVNNDWGFSLYPMVPGHEIIGRVREVGDSVTQFKPGDLVGVGVMVDSCQQCGSCDEHLEQYCEAGFVGTYSAEDKKHNEITQGGYAQKIVVNEEFVLTIPESIHCAAAAPLLCAGITTWSPLSHWKVGKGQKVGVIGLGGLGHMAIKFAHALGAKVVMITTSPDKAKDAKKLGADGVLLSTDEDQMNEHANSFDFLLNTIPVPHDINPYVTLLKRDATMVIVGAIDHLKDELYSGGLIFGRKRIAGSVIGGIKETQEMLEFCGKHNITADIELIDIQEINHAYERMKKNDIKYRFVIDNKTLESA